MWTVSQPKLQEDQRKQFIYMQNKAEKIIVELDIQLDSDTKNHKNIRNVLQVVFWRASPSWNTRFDETFPTKASSLSYGAISVMAHQCFWNSACVNLSNPSEFCLTLTFATTCITLCLFFELMIYLWIVNTYNSSSRVTEKEGNDLEGRSQAPL